MPVQKNNLFYRLKPLFLTVFLVVFDQLSKMWVMKNIPENTLYKSFFNDFLWIVHVRNTGAAFSLGASSSDYLRIVLFIVFPVIMMAIFTWIIVSEKKQFLTRTQKWLASGILGGGIGTIIDRIFRFNDGVVDFISVKFYGILGMDRWPTFNISDSCVVVFVILLGISIFFTKEKEVNANSQS